MTRNHFSKKGGPYFISDGFSKHPQQAIEDPATKVSYIGRIRSFFKSRFKSRQG